MWQARLKLIQFSKSKRAKQCKNYHIARKEQKPHSPSPNPTLSQFPVSNNDSLWLSMKQNYHYFKIKNVLGNTHKYVIDTLETNEELMCKRIFNLQVILSPLPITATLFTKG